MFRGILFVALVTTAGVAQAGDKPVYAPAPDWVKAAPPIDVAVLKDDAPVFLLLDAQQRAKDGEVYGYVDTMARIATTQMLDSAGTIKLPWQPDKGDLIIHRVEIIRGTDHIDLIAAGQRFQVLRREEQLEQRMLNGVLTATLAVEGLRVGDVLRATFSITQKDPALKGNVQLLSSLPVEPFNAKFARSRVIWPKNSELYWRINVPGITPQIGTSGEYNELILPLPLPKPGELPGDAPARYKIPALLEATTFSDWASISTVMAPLYVTDGLIAPGGPLAAEVAKIMAAESDPVKRTALALALVQDKIRYLFKGMDGGNYTPQSPSETWTLRYGDCKAKTLLLLALLHQMGIEAEPVLASSQFGDALPMRLPTPGAFDHVFVRGTIAGETLWLDGTGSGSTLADIRDTPPLGNVLPLRAAGAALLTIPRRPSARPDLTAAVDLDETAGVNFPAPFKIAITVRGQLAQLFKSAAAQAGKDQLTDIATKLSEDYVSSPSVVTRSFTFDDATATATLNATGLSYPDWDRENERYRSTLDSTLSGMSFEPDRSRVAWREIPVSTGNAEHIAIRTRIVLPDGGVGFTLDGNAALSDTLAGHRIERKATLADGVVTVDASQTSTGEEIAVADIAAVRKKLTQAKLHLLRLEAPATLPAEWQIVESAKRARKFDPILALYKQSIADQPGKAEPYTNRAWFMERIYDWRGAIDDVTRAIAIDPSLDSYLWRARLLTATGDRRKALADVLAARKIDPASGPALRQLAWIYARTGDKAQAVTLLDERIDEGGKDKSDYVSTKASILAENGDKEGAIALMDAAIASSPGNADLLNSRCWLKGTMDTMLDTALKDCTKSIELSESPGGALDSRAMVYFRLNRLDDALADLQAALDISPGLPASMYMRGVIRGKQGDAKASAIDLAAARTMAPTIDETYARYGIKP